MRSSTSLCSPSGAHSGTQAWVDALFNAHVAFRTILAKKAVRRALMRAANSVYATSALAYLHRARARLADGTPEGLFYAAQELRSGIEARMHEYLEAREDITERKRHGYQVAKLAKGLDRVFAAGEQVVEISAVSEDGQPLWILYFTPVRGRLRKHAGRLGDLLHRQPYRSTDEKWWDEQRTFLEEVAEELKFATTGTLVGPPLLEKGTRKMSFVVVGDSSEDFGAHLARIGDSVVLNVAYLDDLPPSLGACSEVRSPQSTQL